MKRMNYIKAAALLATTLVAASCSIKEDRSPCPCWLVMDITGCASHTTEISLSAWSTENLFSDKVSVADYPDVYERTVTKGMVATSAYCGLGESKAQGSRIIIPEGYQADMLKVHTNLVDCTGEFAKDSVQLNRQYATVYMSMKDESAKDVLHTMEVRGEVCGIDYVTLEPVEGPFRYRTEANDEGIWSFRLPRQKESCGLSLVTFEEGTPKDDLPLDEWILKSGYSWLDKDLKDIYINVDYAIGKVSVVIQGWVEGEYVDITL